MKSSRRQFALAAGGLLAAGRASRVLTASAQESVSLIVYGDMVQGGKNVPEDQREAKSCVLNNRFPRNSEVVWRVRVLDPVTGESMDDTMLDTVEVTLGDGEVLAMRYGGHPPQQNRDFYWTTPWTVPKDYPTGTLTYTVMATATDGRSGEFKPFDVPSSMLTIIDEVLEDIEEEE